MQGILTSLDQQIAKAAPDWHPAHALVSPIITEPLRVSLPVLEICLRAFLSGCIDCRCHFCFVQSHDPSHDPPPRSRCLSVQVNLVPLTKWDMKEKMASSICGS